MDEKSEARAFRDRWKKAVIADPSLTAGQKIIAVVIADRYLNLDADNPRYMKAWPTHRTLATDTALRENTVQVNVKNLEKLGYLTVEKARSKSGHARNVYALVLPACEAQSHPDESHGGYASHPDESHGTTLMRVITHPDESQDNSFKDSIKDSINKELLSKSSLDDSESDVVKAEPVTKTNPNTYPQAFEEWWEVYPKRVGKRKALAEWRRARKRVDDDTLMKATHTLAAFHQTQATDKKFIPHPTTWLHRDGWDDELVSQQPPSGKIPNTVEAWMGAYSGQNQPYQPRQGTNAHQLLMDTLAYQNTQQPAQTDNNILDGEVINL